MYDIVCPVGWTPVCSRLMDYVIIYILMQSSVRPGWESALLIPNRAPRHPPRLGGVTGVVSEL